MADFTRFTGDTDPRVYEFTDANGVVIDITGWETWLTISRLKNPEDTSTQIANITGTIAVGTDGRAEYPFDGTIEAGEYHYDIRAKDAGGILKVWKAGECEFEQSIGKNT